MLLATPSSPMRLVDSLLRTQGTSALALVTLSSCPTRLFFYSTTASCGSLVNNHPKSSISSYLLASATASANRSTFRFFAGTMFRLDMRIPTAPTVDVKEHPHCHVYGLAGVPCQWYTLPIFLAISLAGLLIPTHAATMSARQDPF